MKCKDCSNAFTARINGRLCLSCPYHLSKRVHSKLFCKYAEVK